MPDRYTSVTPALGGTTANTAETVIATSPPISGGRSGLAVTIDATAAIVVGTGGTGVTYRVRRTGLTGAQVGDAFSVAAAAGAVAPLGRYWIDTPGDIASQVYVLTATQNGSATAAGAVNQAGLETHIDA